MPPIYELLCLVSSYAFIFVLHYQLCESSRRVYNINRKIAMAYWTYKCYDDGKTPNLWRRWYDEQDSRVRGKHDAVFEILATQDHWAQPHYKQLSDGLAEITLKGNVQWRIFGVADFHRKLFTVAGIGFHKSDVYSPRKIMETCRKRIKEIGLDKRKAIACEKPE